MKIEFYKNYHKYSTEFPKEKFLFVKEQCLKISEFDQVNWNKIWIYDDYDNLCNIIRTDTKQITKVTTLDFTNYSEFSFYKNLPKEYQKIYYDFVCAGWVGLLYLSYNGLTNYNSDLLNFIKIFPINDIKHYAQEMIEDFYSSECGDWIAEGMRLKNNCFLTDRVIDNLFGIDFKPIEKQIIVSREFGMYSGMNKDPNYNGWVSTEIINELDDSEWKYKDSERFVIPNGFPCCIIPNYITSNIPEIVVRNNDLCKL